MKSKKTNKSNEQRQNELENKNSEIKFGNALTY